MATNMTVAFDTPGGGTCPAYSYIQDMKTISGRMTFPNAYEAGGHVLKTEKPFFRKLMGVLFENKDGYSFEYDHNTGKVKAFYILCDTSVTITPGEVPAGKAVDIVVEHGAFKVGDYLAMQPPIDLEAGLVPIAASVTEAGKAKVRIYNPTAAAVTGVGRSWNLLTLTPSKREVFANKNLSSLGSIRFIAWGI